MEGRGRKHSSSLLDYHRSLRSRAEPNLPSRSRNEDKCTELESDGTAQIDARSPSAKGSSEASAKPSADSRMINCCACLVDFFSLQPMEIYRVQVRTEEETRHSFGPVCTVCLTDDHSDVQIRKCTKWKNIIHNIIDLSPEKVNE